jgi:hypothetical protein
VSEGDPEYRAAVAGADSRVRELGWHQRELAECSRVPVAVVREIRRCHRRARSGLGSAMVIDHVRGG